MNDRQFRNVLADMALFAEVAGARSYSRAARSTGIATSTLSRRIAALERRLGVRLFERSTRRFALTEAGEAYFVQCQAILAAARASVEELTAREAGPSGTLRVSMTPDFGIAYLAPHLAAFALAHPALELVLDLSPRAVDLIADRYDVAIRMGEQRDSSIVARRLARLGMALYASPAYLARHGTPREPDELLGHECLALPHEHGRWRLSRGEDVAVIETRSRVTLNNPAMSHRFAALDVGIASIGDRFAGPQVADGTLVRVLPEWRLDGVSVYAVTTSRMATLGARSLLAFLADRLEHESAAHGPVAPVQN